MEPRDDEKTDAGKTSEANAPSVDAASGGASETNPERGGKGRGGGKGARGHQNQTTDRGGKSAQAEAQTSGEPAKALRPGLVELVALKTCAAHGMPHFAGDHFSASEEVASKLLRKGEAERA